ncbi:MAG: alpha/beta hydrolase, partial [Planctomycetota bacterium]|nr:alpha/beta hydrolase [Planctomycetota bacterium]
MRYGLTALIAVLVSCLAASTGAAALKEGVVVHLWPESVLAAAGLKGEEKAETKGGVTRISNVTDPTLTVHKPEAAADTGAAVVICPGGGYSILAWDLEGTEVAEWLNSIGVTGVILKYRVPGKRDLAFQDAQRAVSIVRSRAAEWKIDPARIGILGFSAGGHLTVRVSTNFKTRSYTPIDKCDEASCRPDFAIPIYPAYLVHEGTPPTADTTGLPIGPDTPPMFMAVGASDKFAIDSLVYGLALKLAKVPFEVHVFQFGGHGCGLRPRGANITDW